MLKRMHIHVLYLIGAFCVLIWLEPSMAQTAGGGGASASSSAVTRATTIAGMASNLKAQFRAIGELMTGTAYIAGIGFGISAIFKFKQHKDNPTQVPIGTPFALLAISVLLVFLPGLYKPAAKSIYGTTTNIGGGFDGAGAQNLPG